MSSSPAPTVPPDLHAVVTARLRRDDQRYTPRRRALVEVLDEAVAPLTIPQILDRRPGLAQSSAYRNLAVLERAGVIHRIVTTTDEFARYELAEGLTKHHHHHLICTTCGAVADFTVSATLERRLGEALEDAAREAGFRIDHHRLDLVGVCARCE